MASIESTASTKRKTKESIRVESLLPEDLRENSANLIELLEDYYRFMNKGFNPSYEINTIAEERDIDTLEHYTDQIQKEIAISIPRNISVDRIKLYKNLVKYYNIRGSTDSIETFFKIFLNDNVEVYYPKNDMLIPSDGKWDNQIDNGVAVQGDYVAPLVDTSVIVIGNFNEDVNVNVKGDYTPAPVDDSVITIEDTAVVVKGDYNPNSVAYVLNDVVRDTGDTFWYKNILAYTSNATQPSANATNWVRYDVSGYSVVDGVAYRIFIVTVQGDYTAPLVDTGVTVIGNFNEDVSVNVRGYYDPNSVVYAVNDVVNDGINNGWYKNIAGYTSNDTQPSANATNWVRYDLNGYSVVNSVAYKPGGVSYALNNIVKDPNNNFWYKNILGYTSNTIPPKDNLTNWVRYDVNGYAVVNDIAYLPGTSYALNDVVRDTGNNFWYKNIKAYRSDFTQPHFNTVNWVRYDYNGYSVVGGVAYAPGILYLVNDVVRDNVNSLWYKNVAHYTADSIQPSVNNTNWVRYDDNGYLVVDGVAYAPQVIYSPNDVVKDTGNNLWYKNIVGYTSNATQPSANATNWVRYDDNGYSVIGDNAYLPGTSYALNDVVRDTGNNFWYKNILAYTSNATQPSANATNWVRYNIGNYSVENGIAYSGRFLTNDGFLSDRKKLQDSYFYQKFSYVIRTGSNINVWQDVFDRLVHPSGFIYFGEIVLFIYLLQTRAKMPFLQPGLISAEDLPLLIELFGDRLYAEFATLTQGAETIEATFTDGYVPYSDGSAISVSGVEYYDGLTYSSSPFNSVQQGTSTVEATFASGVVPFKEGSVLTVSGVTVSGGSTNVNSTTTTSDDRWARIISNNRIEIWGNASFTAPLTLTGTVTATGTARYPVVVPSTVNSTGLRLLDRFIKITGPNSVEIWGDANFTTPLTLESGTFTNLGQAEAKIKSVSVAYVEFILRITAEFVGGWQQQRQDKWTDLLKFYDETAVGDFQIYTIEQGINKQVVRNNVGVYIKEYPNPTLPPDEWTEWNQFEFEDGYFLVPQPGDIDYAWYN